MRILMLNWKDPADAAAGGAEAYVSRVAKRWAEQGHSISLFVPLCPGRPAHEVVDGVEYIRSGTRLSVFRDARAYLRRHGSRYDRVVESVSTRPFFAHREVGRRATALYHQIADDVWPQEYAFPVSVVGRHVIEPVWIRRMRNARVVTVSDSNALALQRRGVTVSAVVPPGSDLPESIPERTLSSPPRLVFAGRLNRTKRPGDAIHAFSLIRHEFPGATLDVIGTGYLLEELRRQVHHDGAILHGYLHDDDKSRLLFNADLILIPGTREGWGIVALEAAGHGIPAIAYDIPGLCDAVVDGVTGVLSARSPEAMAAAAVTLLRSPAQWLRLRSAARERALEFTWDRTAKDLMDALLIDPSALLTDAA